MTNNKDKKVLNVPNLRFPEFTEEWERCSLGHVTDFVKERISTDKLTLANYVSTENMKSDFGGINPAISIPNNTNVIHYKKGDVLLSNIRPYLRKVWAANSDGGCSTDVFVFRAKSISPSFLHYIMANDTFINYVMSGAKGVKMPRGDKEQMLKYVFSIPRIEEQYKISRLLHLLDDRIATQNKIIEKYESLIQAICDTLIESGQPKVELSFNDFGEPYSGLSGKSAEDFGKGWPYITYMNVYQNQIIDITDVGLVKINETEQQSVVRYGDILFTLSSETPDEVGMGAVYLGDIYPLYLNSFCFGVHITDESKIYPPFLAYYISTKSFRKAVFPLAQGSTRFNLQKSDFMKKKFLFPTVEEQNKIYSVLKAYSDKLSIEKNIANLLCEQKSYLLRQLFI
ncbi:restriction endonuclease subunit S [Phocaeicola sp.]